MQPLSASDEAKQCELPDKRFRRVSGVKVCNEYDKYCCCCPSELFVAMNYGGLDVDYKDAKKKDLFGVG